VSRYNLRKVKRRKFRAMQIWAMPFKFRCTFSLESYRTIWFVPGDWTIFFITFCFTTSGSMPNCRPAHSRPFCLISKTHATISRIEKCPGLTEILAWPLKLSLFV
jgi:hypothetical protein